MANYRKASHTTYDCRYHIIWITKYRRQIINSSLKKRLETIITGICKEMYVKIIKIGFEQDHVHLYVSIPPKQPIPYVVQKLKGRTSNVIRKEFKTYLSKFYWKPVLWAVGYFVATVGEITHEIISNYVEQQGKEDVLGDDKEINL